MLKLDHLDYSKYWVTPLCFWYMAVGEEEAMQHVSLCDVGSDTVDFISKVMFFNMYIKLHTLGHCI